MDKRQADGDADANAPSAKRGRWDTGPVPGAAVPGAPVAAAAAAAAAALAAAVAAKYTQIPSGRGAGLVSLPGPTPGTGAPHLSAGAAAAVAQAAAAALQKLPLAATGGLVPGGAALAAAATSGSGPRPQSLSLDALEKAKKALQLQKEIQEKLKSRLPQLAAKLAAPGAGAGPAAANGGSAGAFAAGATGLRPPMASPSVRPPLGLVPSLAAGGATPMPGMQAAGIASMLPRPSMPPPLVLAPPAPAPEEEETGEFYDPGLARGAAARKGERRRRGGFDFVQEGRYQREAELFRLKSQLGAAAFRRGAPRVNGPLGGPSRLPPGAGGMAANLVPLGVRQPMPADKAPSREASPAPEAEPVPAVEWWDRGLLAHASLDQDVPALPAEAVGGPTVATADDHDGDADIEMTDGPGGGGEGGGEGDGGEGGERETAAADDDEVPDPAVATAAVVAAVTARRAAVVAAAEAAAAGQLGSFQLRESRITIYVEHPVPLEPPAEAPPPPPQPLKLTAKELKKLRTQRRLARDKEKQELIRQGLLEPPKPKVRIANLHRVLGTDAALDPTAVEKEVRKQMAERQAAHDDRNLARKLTPAERRDKKLRKLFGSAAVEAGVAELGSGGRGAPKGAAATAAAAAAAAAGIDVMCSVYRVGRLTDAGHRFKLDVNAKENHMTGIMVTSDDFSLVVVEGIEKATKRYMKLMLRRIDWSTAPATTAAAGGARAGGRGANGDAAMRDEEDDEEDDEEERPPPNVCTLVWQGTVLRRAFSGFRCEAVRSGAAARQLLEDAGVKHYWDAAAAAVEGQDVPFSL